jgi:hypothetical protein
MMFRLFTSVEFLYRRTDRVSSGADLHRRDRALGHSVDRIGHHRAGIIHALAFRIDQVDGIHCTRQDCCVSFCAAGCRELPVVPTRSLLAHRTEYATVKHISVQTGCSYSKGKCKR